MSSISAKQYQLTVMKIFVYSAPASLRWPRTTAASSRTCEAPTSSAEPDAPPLYLRAPCGASSIAMTTMRPLGFTSPPRPCRRYCGFRCLQYKG